MSGSSFARFGVAVGHATDLAGATGLTVVRGVRGPLRAGVAVVGRASGSRELLAAAPAHLVDRVDAVLLTGGSAYGLDSAAGVMQWMEERGQGFPVGDGVVPIVPAAVVFDLAPLGSFAARPTPAMAYDACEAASSVEIAEGSVGAGTGCTVGKALGPAGAMKGGVGVSILEEHGVAVGALAVVNSFGDVRGAGGEIVAGARGADGRFADGAAQLAAGVVGGAGARFGEVAMRNTTLAVVVTEAVLGRVELAQVAAAASAALFRRITPAGTSYDGDVVFALCAAPDAGGPPQVEDATIPAASHHPPRAKRTEPVRAAATAPSFLQLEVLAVRALEAAIERAVLTARGREGVPGLADTSPEPDARRRGRDHDA